MKAWQKVSCLLCVFGFLRELRPSEPYIIEFLLGEWKNLTEDQVNKELYPTGTYSYSAQLVVVFLITDFLRYKPLIVLMGIAGITVWSLLLWANSISALQIMEVFYGTYLATEIAYFTYIYAKVDKKHYPQVTSYARAAMLTGQLVAGVLAQTLVNLKLMNYKDLNYISLGAQIAATLWALFLPKVTRSVYFHRNKATVADGQPSNNKMDVEIYANAPISSFQLLWSHFKNAYSNTKVVQWSIWYAVGICGYYQVYQYSQLLWKEIEPEPTINWNGAVEAILTLLGAIFALVAGFVHGGRFSPRASLLALAILSIIEGGAVLLSTWTTNIFMSYAGYIIFGALYAFTSTVSSAEVARHLEEDSFGFVFGINTLMALLLQTILTLVVVSKIGFALNVVDQFTVYAFYFICIGAVYFLAVVIEYFISRTKASKRM